MTAVPTTPPSHERARVDAVDATPALRVHATLQGRGTAADGARPLGEVDYSLRDVEEVRPTGPDAGARNIFGIVTSVPAGLLAGFVGARLALHLADGRRLPFTVAKVIGPRTFLIQALGAPE